jgi:hypothetical protein
MREAGASAYRSAARDAIPEAERRELPLLVDTVPQADSNVLHSRQSHAS